MSFRESLSAPHEQIAARTVGIAITAMLCAGLLSRKPWLSQTIDWAVLLPAGAWLVWLTVAPAQRTRPQPTLPG